MTFRKHRFSLSKTFDFELGAPPEHEKSESESDAETKLNFRAFFEHFWSSKGLILEQFWSHFGALFLSEFLDRFWSDFGANLEATEKGREKKPAEASVRKLTSLPPWNPPEAKATLK